MASALVVAQGVVTAAKASYCTSVRRLNNLDAHRGVSRNTSYHEIESVGFLR
jgi:hypothetical protein